MSILRDLLRSPVLHFVLLGGLVFGSERLLIPEYADSSTMPQAAVEQLSTDDILLRDALALGLDRTDPLVRERLARLGEAVATGEVPERAELEREARRLGLDHTDPVVRRRLIAAMELAFSRVDPSEWPGEDEVRAYFAGHADRYTQPARYEFAHVYFARDRSGERPERAAAEALVVLEGEGTSPNAMGASDGDAFLLGGELGMTGPELARRFGEEFAAALEGVATRKWVGPLPSPFGVHLVWLKKRTSANIATLESVRGRVVHDLLAERAAEQLEQRIGQRREAYSR